MKSILITAVAVCLFVSPAAISQDDMETCMSCHEDSELEGIDRSGRTISMFVDSEKHANSVHGEMDCIECHTDLEGFDDYPHEEELALVDCSGCHDDVADIYNQSAHGEALDAVNAATCASCHGTHNILADEDPEATTSLMNLPVTCSACHHKNGHQTDPDIKVADPFDRFMKGIHAEGAEKGIETSANCSDCHGIHDLKRASHPESRVNHKNLPKTCSQCHRDIYIKYSRGIHGKALAAGIKDSPNCSDCHGEHEILGISDPTSPVNASNLADYVCGKCHNDQELIDKYGLSHERFSSYQDSYHGLAMKGGSVKAANCISCHEAHDILPESNPASSIHEDNLVATCQKCHPKANVNFASSYSHNLPEHEHSALNRTVEIAYIILIVLVIGGMLVHNGIIFIYFVVQKYRRERKQPRVARFSGSMVFQHILLILSFVILVITGFALRYPEAWWVNIFSFFGILESTRSVIHRIAAVALLYVSVHHLFFLLLSKRGKKEFKAMLPNKSDLSQAIQNVKFHLGLTKEKPRFAQYDYTEKAEYWALVWGTALMALTGFVLWFPTFFTSFLPAWVIKIAETIHLYEAWLATLAIVVFHLFFVVFHPERYPMSLTWVNGKMSKHEVDEHHPGWADEVEVRPPAVDKTEDQKPMVSSK